MFQIYGNWPDIDVFLLMYRESMMCLIVDDGDSCYRCFSRVLAILYWQIQGVSIQTIEINDISNFLITV